MCLKPQQQRDVVGPPSAAVGPSPHVAAPRLSAQHSPLGSLGFPSRRRRQRHKQGHSLASSRLWYPLLALKVSVATETSPGVFQPESSHRHQPVHHVQQLCSPNTAVFKGTHHCPHRQVGPRLLRAGTYQHHTSL